MELGPLAVNGSAISMITLAWRILTELKGPQPGAGPKLSIEAQKVFAEANLAFVSGQTREALHLFQEVIRVEPKHYPVRIMPRLAVD